MIDFWKDSNKPMFALAPMEDVTDTVFREVVLSVADASQLQVLYTEFTNVNGMNHPVGRISVGERLIINSSEFELLKQTGVKLVAQVWGKDPEIFHKVVGEIAADGRFDGIDINMGCPVKKVVKNGCCSALIGSPELAKEIIRACKEATKLPVSVKTRTGLKEHITESWIANLLETEPSALILHGRTQKQQSDGLADWNQIALAVQLRNQLKSTTAILGNGDVMSYSEGLDKCKVYGTDGIMVGRGIFHNPWFFSSDIREREINEKLGLLHKHTRLFEQTWGGKKNFNILKRFFKIYTNNFAGASALRNELMETNNLEEVEKVIARYLLQL